MNKRRKFFGLLLAVAMLFLLVPQGTVAAFESDEIVAMETSEDTTEESQITEIEGTTSSDVNTSESISEEQTISVAVEDVIEENITESEEPVEADETAESPLAETVVAETIPADEKLEVPSEHSEALEETLEVAEEVTEVNEENTENVPLLRAGGSPQVVNVEITKFEIQNYKHETGTTVNIDDSVYLSLNWEIDKDVIVSEGDYFDITLPDNMKFPTTTTPSTFNLTDENGTVVATAYVTPGPDDAGGTVHVVFNSAMENRYNVKGTMYFAARLNQTQVTTGSNNTFTITINSGVSGKTQTLNAGVVITGPTEIDDEILKKLTGGPVDDTKTAVYWMVRINYEKATLSNVVITDTLGSTGETYLQNNFVLRRVEFDSVGKVSEIYEIIDLSDKLSFSADGSSFTLNLGDINGEQYYLTYRSTYTEGTALTNSMTMTSSERTETSTATNKTSSAGGTGGGSLASRIKIIKVDEDDTSITLANAVFKVTGPNGNSFTLTTGADGTVTSGVLQQGTYTVEEIEAPDGYAIIPEESNFTLEVTSDGGAVQRVKNRAVSKIDIPVSKVWSDNGDQDGIRPTSITVKLLAGGNDTGKTVTLNEDNNWTASFTDLDEFANGQKIVYSIEELDVEGYAATVSGDAATGFTVTNEHTPGKTSVSVTKAWEDNNNQDGIRPTSITVKLLAGGNDTGKTVTLNEDNNWTASFTDLDEFANGQKIVYSIEELDVEGYISEIDGDATAGYTVTNSHTPEEIDISGTKTWEDNNDQDGIRPAGITIRLLANDTEVASKTITEADGWSWTFTGLPKFEDGEEIAYSIKEDAVSGYTSAYSGYNVTNEHTPIKTSITVTKVWNDQNDKDKIRPKNVTIHLLADGKDAGKTLVLNADNNWTGSFADLDVNKEGKRITYTVSEEDVSGYTKAISGDVEKGYTVTNSHTPEEPPTTPQKTPDTPKPGHPPKTGDDTNAALYLWMMAISSAALIVLLFIWRRRSSGKHNKE